MVAALVRTTYAHTTPREVQPHSTDEGGSSCGDRAVSQGLVVGAPRSSWRLRTRFLAVEMNRGPGLGGPRWYDWD